MSQIKKIAQKALWGLFLIGAGILLLLSNYGLIDYRFTFRHDWPAILVLIGLAELIDALD